MNSYLQKKHSNLFLLIICLVFIFCLTGCNNLRLHQDNDQVSATQKTLTAVAGNTALNDGVPNYEKGFAVSGWPGRVIDFPAESEYDNYLMWLPEGSGETGISGATNKIDATIMAVADSQKTFLFWGLLTCNESIDDYRNCRLEVTDLQPAGSDKIMHAGKIEGWAGQIINHSSNSERLIFVLSGRFPVKFTIDKQLITTNTSNDETDILGKSIRIWGDIISGDTTNDMLGINLADISIGDTISSSTDTDIQQPLALLQEEPENWLAYSSDSLHISFKYPPSAILIERGTLTNSSGDIINIITNDDVIIEEGMTFSPLCIRLEYGLGYIAITSADDLINHYVACGRVLSSTGSLKGIEQEVILFGKTVPANGFEYIGSDEHLKNHFETFNYQLPDSSLLEFGALEADNHSYDEYLHTTKESIIQILKTFRVN